MTARDDMQSGCSVTVDVPSHATHCATTDLVLCENEFSDGNKTGRSYAKDKRELRIKKELIRCLAGDVLSVLSTLMCGATPCAVTLIVAASRMRPS